MRLTSSATPGVTYTEARARVLRYWESRGDKWALVPASWFADAIWPGHQMAAQGAGAAASRILKRMEQAGEARWKSDRGNWGWTILLDNNQGAD